MTKKALNLVKLSENQKIQNQLKQYIVCLIFAVRCRKERINRIKCTF